MYWKVPSTDIIHYEKVDCSIRSEWKQISCNGMNERTRQLLSINQNGGYPGSLLTSMDCK